MTNDIIIADKLIKKNYFDGIFVGRPFFKNPFFYLMKKL